MSISIDLVVRFYVTSNETVDNIKSRAKFQRKLMSDTFGPYATISLHTAGYYPLNQNMYFLHTLTFNSERELNVFKLKDPDKYQLMRGLQAEYDVILDRITHQRNLETEAFEDLLYDES